VQAGGALAFGAMDSSCGVQVQVSRDQSCINQLSASDQTAEYENIPGRRALLMVCEIRDDGPTLRSDSLAEFCF
jgi:hypothetical protein